MWRALIVVSYFFLWPSSAATDDPPAPELFQVSFETNVVLDGAAAEPMVLEVNRSWAPIGADRFYALVNDRYYDDAAFFRVVPSFVVQWGIAALPEETKKWDEPIQDDPVLVSNPSGTVTYAATSQPNSRTTQIFINYVDNRGWTSCCALCESGERHGDGGPSSTPPPATPTESASRSTPTGGTRPSDYLTVSLSPRPSPRRPALMSCERALLSSAGGVRHGLRVT